MHEAKDDVIESVLNTIRNNTRLFAIIFISLVTALIAFLLNHPVMSQTKIVQSQLGNHRFIFSIADTESSRQQGLSDTSSLEDNHGMIFIFQNEENSCFWMKDMHYNLDILWFNKQKRLVYDIRNVSPSTYPSTFCTPTPALYVVEINAGVADSLGLQRGAALIAPNL